MYFNRLHSVFISTIFILLILNAINFSTLKITYAYDNLINYNNNFQLYAPRDDPNKISAINHIDCVVNFMQRYIFTSSSADGCNRDTTTNSQAGGNPPPDNPQTGFPQQSTVGVVKVVNVNSKDAEPMPVKSSSTSTHHTSSSQDTISKHSHNKHKHKEDHGKKVYNENNVGKDDRKILLTTCFERAYNKGHHLSSNEIVHCAKNYIH